MLEPMSAAESFALEDFEAPHVTMHTFAIAHPGMLDLVTMESPQRPPVTRDEYLNLIKVAAGQVQVDPKYVRYLGGVELFDEPWVDPAKREAAQSSIITPDRKIVVPPGVKL